MRIKETLRKVWTWRRDRAARRLRERLLKELPKMGLGILACKAAEAYIMAAPRRHRNLRERLLIRYNSDHRFNADGLNPPDPTTRLRTRKALLVEGYILRSELDPGLLYPSAPQPDSRHSREEGKNHVDRD